MCINIFSTSAESQDVGLHPVRVRRPGRVRLPPVRQGIRRGGGEGGGGGRGGGGGGHGDDVHQSREQAVWQGGRGRHAGAGEYTFDNYLC